MAAQRREKTDESPQQNATMQVALERVQAALLGLRFGDVKIIVQDGVIVQIERTERMRLDKRERSR